MRILLLAAIAASTPVASQAQTWYGRDLAATAEPIRTVEPERSRASRERPRVVESRPDGWRPQRNLYVDPLGRVTVWAGAPPFWANGALDGYYASTPDERAYYGQRSRSQSHGSSDPCAPGIGGAASASAAIGSAASAGGRRC
jgi:hypothetical protein